MTRSGTPCRHGAGARTDHPGEGRCWLHGGRAGRPIEHGLYSKRTSPLADLIEEHLQNPTPADTRNEVAVLRASLDRFLQRFNGDSDEHFVLLAGLVDRISRVAARLDQVAARQSVSRDDLLQLMEAMGSIVRQHVGDAEAVAIGHGWGALRFTESPTGLRFVQINGMSKATRGLPFYAGEYSDE